VLARPVHLIRSRIAVKLTLTLVGFVAVALAVAGLYLDGALERLAVEALEARLAAAARLLLPEAQGLLARGAAPAELRRFALRAAELSGARVTLIATDGRLLGDSEVAPADLGRLENHAGRPEVREALAGRPGRDLRRSATIDVPLLYVALPVTHAGRVAGVLRLALPLSVVRASHAGVTRAIVAGGLVALAVALGIGLFVAARVTRPVTVMQAAARAMSEGDFGARVPVRSPDEIGRLGRALNAMAARLAGKIEDLEHERAKVSAILDAMVEGVVAVDGRDQVVLMNERARSMFGLGPERGGRAPFLEVIRSVDLHRLLHEARTAHGGVGARGELTLPGTVERRLQVNAVPLRLAGDEAGVVMVLHDVTELRRLERVRTEFVANVSHELRTPLTAIRGYLETLMGAGPEDREQARRFLEIALRHTERLGRLLDDLTDLSNIELGRITLRLEPTPLAETVESTLAMVAARAEAGGVAVASEIGLDGPVVHADRDRLAQILLNLVDNAVKFTPAGGRVTVGARVRGDGMVEVAVTDTGIGIPAADLAHVTERFYRVDRARSRELGGTGLGLAIVKHLVIAHGGELTIDSEVGRGTVVRFTLPAAGAAASRPSPA
jgi:two-component system phosphate regulon sensor histidine kinase PhoR